MLSFFDKLEDLIREKLSKHPIVYSIIGGFGVVLFWRSVWETADILARINPTLNWIFYAPVQIVLSTLGLMLTGLMVSVFIGDRIILSGLRHEKKMEERTEELVKEEEITLENIRDEIHTLKKEIEKLSNATTKKV
ncbi:MAG: hypothetical protein EXS47_02395 [Candidatus Zambryskibacteria bacterium]|nr:hypothetical protein [Candidatus Zambryskibacteria bacterium]